MNESVTGQNVEKQEVVVEKPKKKRGKWFLILLLLIVAVAVGLYFGFQRLTANPLSVYRHAINETYELLDNYLKENSNSSFTLSPFTEPWTINADFTVNTDMEELSLLNDYEYHLSIGMDYANETINLGLGLNEDTEEILSLLISYLNDRAYLESDALFDRILDLGDADLNIDLTTLPTDSLTINYEDLHIVLQEMKDILINSLNQDKFSSSEETIEIDGTSINTTKYTYLLDEENLERTMNYIAEEMKNNEELLTAISNISGLSTDEIISSLEEDTDYSNIGEIKINLYARSGNNVIAGDLTLEEETIIHFTYQEEILELTMGDDTTNIILTAENNTLTMSYNEYDEELMYLAFTLDNNSEKIEVRLNQYGEEYTFNIELSNMEDSTDTYQTDFIFDLYINNAEIETNLELEGTLNIEKGELELLDPINSVDINTLSEEEQLEIVQNLLTILERLGLSELAQTL